MNTPPNEPDWNLDLIQPVSLELSTWECEQTQKTPVITLPIRVKTARVHSYFFTPEAKQENGEDSIAKGFLASDPKKNRTEKKSVSRPTSQSRTRIKPPRDVIKLSDRLFYVLQPPLETLLASNTIEFPFKPFDFQYLGVAFLFPRHSAILADEMGLGKTMQAITSIRMLLRSGYLKNVLLICPKPLVTNWQREFALWAPEVPVSIISGSQPKRRWHWENDKTPVRIANYELMVRDEHYVTHPESPYDLVVLDEAQRVKNKSNSTSKVIRTIPRQRSWALTGTPIENSIEDLIGIFEFVSPGAINSFMSPRELKKEVKDFVLRRTKDMVLKDMPPKLIRDTELSLTGEQYDSYQQAEKDGVLKLNDLGAEITIKHVFELVLRLKQICNFDPSTGRSSKLELLQSDMEEVAASGQKVIVFSQWVKSLDTLSEHLHAYNPLAYHGRIPSNKRDAILAEFKESPDRHILLMSYGAGSVGLNLQFCRYVYLFDRWWNPAVEDQAINRAHRIGAAGSVTVTRMISAGTIEQRIHEILESKRELFNEILSDNRNPASYGLSKDEIFGLFKLKTPDGKISKVA
ncbi:MAG: DEAD/DEAH box helicase [Mariniblastus sp.]|nr:DEAD/DEAH box helicase [Mariniblastus sp.]